MLPFNFILALAALLGPVFQIILLSRRPLELGLRVIDHICGDITGLNFEIEILLLILGGSFIFLGQCSSKLLGLLQFIDIGHEDACVRTFSELGHNINTRLPFALIIVYSKQERQILVRRFLLLNLQIFQLHLGVYFLLELTIAEVQLRNPSLGLDAQVLRRGLLPGTLVLQLAVDL